MVVVVVGRDLVMGYCVNEIIVLFSPHYALTGRRIVQVHKTNMYE